MTTKEKIEIMQHYENGGVVEVLYRNKNNTKWEESKKVIDGELSWTWDYFEPNYRIKKETVKIEKWLVQNNSELIFNFIIETDNIDNFCCIYGYKKIKLLDVYEV